MTPEDGDLSHRRQPVATLCSLVAALSVVLCLATGARMFTRFEDPEIREANNQDDLSALFEATGIDTDREPIRAVETGFAFGWLPSGAGASSLSVATVAGPSVALAIVLLALQRRRVRRDVGQSTAG